MRTTLLSPEYKRKITQAIGYEFDASHTYKYLSNLLMGLGYFGSAQFFKTEAIDESTHAQKWFDFVNDMQDVAELPTVSPMNFKIMTLREAFTRYYEKEYALMQFYNDWYEECENASIMQRLLFFVETQRKSVGEAGDFLATLDRCGMNESALLLFDNQFKVNG